jgi:hypothetical protein
MGTASASVTTAGLEEARSSANQTVDQLNTAVVYSDQVSAAKALEIHRWVLRQVGPNGPVTTTWWDLEWLKEQDLFESSCRQAAQADILFVAVRASDSFSEELKFWLAGVLRGRARGERALIALLQTDGRMPGVITAVEEYLHRQAESAGVEYFPHRYSSIEAGKTASLSEAARGRTASTTAASENVAPTTGVQHWGLNE